jgi:hypothetical protein
MDGASRLAPPARPGHPSSPSPLPPLPCEVVELPSRQRFHQLVTRRPTHQDGSHSREPHHFLHLPCEDPVHLSTRRRLPSFPFASRGRFALALPLFSPLLSVESAPCPAPESKQRSTDGTPCLAIKHTRLAVEGPDFLHPKHLPYYFRSDVPSSTRTASTTPAPPPPPPTTEPASTPF